MSDRHDVVVVGARCAGSPLAALLARAGLDVAVVDRATFPHDTLSTHIFAADGIAFLDRLGVIDPIRGTGAPFVNRIDTRTDDVFFESPWPLRPGDRGGLVSIRRFVLDPILAGAAEREGAEMHMGTKVTGLLREGGRVTGVRTSDGELHGRLVVGADGRNSTVARLAGARKYNLNPNERAVYWAYFENADAGTVPTFVFHRWDDRLVLGIPCDSGLYSVQVLPDASEIDGFRRDVEDRFMDHAMSCEPVAKAIGGARQAGKFFRMERWTGFFREASGPGWVLAGDAGHFKDPAGGRGIGDALLQADKLAPAIASALERSDADLDRATAKWGRWRDREFATHYWFATDLGKGGALPAILPEVSRGLRSRGKADRLFEIQNHRADPGRVLPPRVPVATMRALARRRGSRLAVLTETAALLAQDGRRRLRTRWPEYADAEASVQDAGPTEVDETSGRARPHAAA
jgi:flavin-dependent dehydrogenase